MGPHEPKEAQAQSIDRLWPAATFVENINGFVNNSLFKVTFTVDIFLGSEKNRNLFFKKHCSIPGVVLYLVRYTKKTDIVKTYYV